MCGNCGEEHTSSYRGCRIYIEAKKRFSPKPESATISSSNHSPQSTFPASVAANQSGNPKHSYANVARAGATGNFDNNQLNGQSPLEDLEGPYPTSTLIRSYPGEPGRSLSATCDPFGSLQLGALRAIPLALWPKSKALLKSVYITSVCNFLLSPLLQKMSIRAG